MNAFKKTLVAIAAVATLGATGLASTQASACDEYGYSLPSYDYNGQPSYDYNSQPSYDYNSQPSYDYNGQPSYDYNGQPSYQSYGYGHRHRSW